MVPASTSARQGRDLQHAAGLRADRQERRIGGPALFPQRRQHDRLDGVEPLQDAQQHLVEPARLVGLGGRHEGVVEAEAVEEGAQARVVVRPEALVLAERVAHAGDRLVAVLLQHLAVGHVLGDLPEPVHVVGEDDQLGGDGVLGQRAEGVAHHGGPRGLAEGAHVRQARRAIAALEDHRLVERRKRAPRLVELALGRRGRRPDRAPPSLSRRRVIRSSSRRACSNGQLLASRAGWERPCNMRLRVRRAGLGSSPNRCRGTSCSRGEPVTTGP